MTSPTLTCQHTIRDTAHFTGKTLYGQRKASVSICPAEIDSGYYFVRRDISSRLNTIHANWSNIIPAGYGTTLGNEHGISISYIDILLAALNGMGIDNARIEIDGPEIPVLDGSARPFVELLQGIGTIAQEANRNVYWVHSPIEYRYQDQYAIMSPDHDRRITLHLADFPPGTHNQVLTFKPEWTEFAKQIAPARVTATFFQEQNLIHLETVKDPILKHILTFAPESEIRRQDLRYEDEFLRHLMLKTLGFLSMMQHPFIGHLYLKNPTTAFLYEFLEHFFAQRRCWSYLDYQDYRRIMLCEKKMNAAATHAAAE